MTIAWARQIPTDVGAGKCKVLAPGRRLKVLVPGWRLQIMLGEVVPDLS